jgi:WhiB family redox-sensing transcriptional regulator
MSFQKGFLQMVTDTPPPCTKVDPELFFAAADQTTTIRNALAAKKVCATCPLIFACLRFALETNDQFAILGGKTPNERAVAQELHRRRGGQHPTQIGTQAA